MPRFPRVVLCYPTPSSPSLLPHSIIFVSSFRMKLCINRRRIACSFAKRASKNANALRAVQRQGSTYGILQSWLWTSEGPPVVSHIDLSRAGESKSTYSYRPKVSSLRQKPRRKGTCLGWQCSDDRPQEPLIVKH